jgi:hypothetical protein
MRTCGIAQKHKNAKTRSAKDSIEIANYRTKRAQYINPIPDSAFIYINKIKALSTHLNYGEANSDSDYFLGAYYKRIEKMIVYCIITKKP